ncbi:hypothetical protein ACLKA6_010465 [Drosophila palustris]
MTGKNPKRLRSETSSTDMKSGRVSDNAAPSPQLIQLINQRFDEQAEHISSSMRDAEARILGVLNDKLSGITGELDQMAQRLQQLERDVGDVRALKEHVASLEAKLSAKIENDANANVVRIHGIPQHEGENLKTLYHSLCFSLHLTPPPRIREIYRPARQKGAAISSWCTSANYEATTNFGSSGLQL